MNEGISLEEAYSLGLLGTEKDFERTCNEDGTVKERPETTTFSIQGDPDKSITVNNTHLQFALVVISILILVAAGLIIRKIRKRKKKVAR